MKQHENLNAPTAHNPIEKEALNLYAHIVNASDDFMNIIDRNYCYVAVSEQLCQAFQQTREHLVGKRVDEVWGHALFEGGIRSRLDKCLAGNQLEHEFEFTFPGKGLRWYSSRFTPYRNKEGEFTYAVVISHDVTERKRLEDQFYQAQKMEAIGTLVGGIAHDFNNMLAGITGDIYLAKKAAKGMPYIEDKLTSVEDQSFRASDMIKQLLTYARKGEVTMKPMLLTPFLKETLKFINTSIPENIEVHQDFVNNPMPINGDITQLHQVLMNLLNNARDALDGVNNPSIHVKLELFHTDENDAFFKHHPYFQPGSYALITVKDNGCGIPESRIGNIFEPFFTTKVKGKGTGLGLAMVFGAIKTHNSYIEVNSQQGKGSTFQIYFPLLNNLEANYEALNNDIIDGHGEVILIVDDNDPARISLKHILESLNYKVLEASDGVEGVNLFVDFKNEIELIIIDVVMPRLGGVEAVSQIRRIQPHAKVIFSTGYDKVEAMKEEHLATDIVLSKPYRIKELSQSVYTQLRKS